MSTEQSGASPPAYPENVRRYVSRICDETHRQFACRAETPAEYAEWQTRARPAYRALLGVPLIEEGCNGFSSKVELGDPVEDLGSYTRRPGCIETEPDVSIRFWLLEPKADGPHPLALTPHGHENGDTYAGIWSTEREREQIEQRDQDVAAQAVQRGYLTIAPATRGMGSNPSSYRIADIMGRHDARDCRCHNWHVVMTGRVMLGERAWDLMRLLDWALARPDVDETRVLMLGNSGGGMATLHAAACDERVTTAVPCCSYNNYVSFLGTLRHCPCNAIPGILQFGEFWDVAGLVAPRHLLTVNGREDPAHPVEEVDHAAERLSRIYRAAGVPDRYEHRYGEGGHRFFSDVMWPWIEEVMARG